MNSRRRALPYSLLISLGLVAGCHSVYKPSAWLTKVPPAQKAQANPLPQTAANVHAGQQLYGQYCSSCHGVDGLGARAWPSLRTARVRGESDGAIHWILVTGSKGHGMPAWRSLGDTALWQLVEAIRAMPPAPR